MDDYISREAAIEAALDYSVDVIENDYDRGYQKAVKDIAKELNTIPAADVVEVVRCKDCIHAGDRDCPIDWPKNGEDYCSFGERRADNGNG